MDNNHKKYDNIINILKNDLKLFDIILVFFQNNNIFNELLEYVNSTDISKKIIFYGLQDLYKLPHNLNYRKISLSDITEIESLYMTYEFSDKIKLIKEYEQFGSIMNYLSNGTITKVEFFDVLLH